MTKPKRPRPPKPVLAWCALHDDDGQINPTLCHYDRAKIRYWSGFATIIRVEIRPAPKRKAKRGAK